MSPHPRHMRDRVIEAMKDCSKVARHIHLPVQSGSSHMLEEMKRLYTREEYLTIVEKLRSAIPEILITTDIIVGFPGESPAAFGRNTFIAPRGSVQRTLRFQVLAAPRNDIRGTCR